MTECPFCRQPVQDFSNNPEFVRNLGEEELSKDIEEKKYPWDGFGPKNPDRRDHKCQKCGYMCRWDWHWCKNCGEYQ